MVQLVKKNLTFSLLLPICLGLFLIVGGILLLWWKVGASSEAQQMLATAPAQLPTSSLPVPSPLPAPPTKLLFGGDLMFDRNIRLAINKNGADFILEPLTDLFANYDLVITNLEGPVTTNPSRSVGSEPGSTNNFIFTFDPVILPMLKKNKMELVDLGNNHIANFGSTGIAETKQLLNQHQIAYFGNTGTEASSSARVTVLQLGNHRVAFVGHNQFTNDGYTTALTDVVYANQLSDLVVVMAHWGNEYEPVAKGVIVDQAHQFVDSGADLVIGTHPHVVQQHEDYQGKRIYYSLGNMVFDQYFSKETQQGQLVEVSIDHDQKMRFKEIPITMLKTGQTTLTQPATPSAQPVP